MDLLLQQYETYLRSWQASDLTIRARLTLARGRLREWGLDGFTVDNVQAFLATDRHGQPRKKWTTATYYNHLVDLCNFLVAAGRLDESPMARVKQVRRPHSKPRPLLDHQVDAVLDLTRGVVRDWALIGLLAGFRSFETAKVRGDHFSEAGLFVHGKGDLEATLPIHDELQLMRDRYPETGFWFPGPEDGHVRSTKISTTFGTIFSALEIEGSYHRLRHTYGSRLIRGGVNVRVVQRLMRHSSLDSTAAYLEVVGDEEWDAIRVLSA